MNVKTITGPSIQAALREARAQLGDHVLLVESTPATETEPATIRVMADAPEAEPVPAAQPLYTRQASSEGARTRLSEALAHLGDAMPSRAADAPAPTATRFGYGGSSPTPPSPDEASSPNGQTSAPTDAPELGGRAAPQSHGVLAQQAGTGRGRFFPSAGAPEMESHTQPATREAMLEAQLTRLNERLDGMERRLVGPDDKATTPWAAHPLFETLVETGMRPATLTALFDELAERGHDPAGATSDELRWAFAQVLRRRIHTPTPTSSAGALAVIGPSGAGKTALLLRLATHSSFFARREPSVIHLRPDDETATAYQDPTDVYRRFGLPVQSVRTEAEMTQALARAEHLGQLLIDTPPLPLPLERGRAVLRRFERLLRPLLPLDVHFAWNATRALDGFDASALTQLPLPVRAVALTHLDETPRWGRLAEWLLSHDLPVQYVARSPHVPDGARAFSATWFVEELMDL
jgi:flagellar biosynthesis GTPase FlhF